MHVTRPLCGSERTNPPTGSVCRSQCYGGHGERETPGTIPNPEAKPLSADGTAPETEWESRTPPDNHSRTGPHHTVRARPAFPGGPRNAGSAAGARFLRRRADVVGQPRVERGQVPPGGPDLLERPALVQPVGGLPAPGRVQRRVPEQVGAVAVPVEAGGHPHQALTVDGPPGRGEPVNLGLEPRALHLVGHGPAVPGHLVGDRKSVV